jgi:hypothetical protein
MWCVGCISVVDLFCVYGSSKNSDLECEGVELLVSAR